MVRLNREEYRDKVYACWIGKNIGGTMGGPYEAKTELLDIKGFETDSGAPLPNDDLDLQLIWLKAMEEYGPYQLSSQVLAEYWISFIPPHWNEYGIAKGNLRAGLLPGVSGEFKNDKWKHSNGAWIRSEVWACMAPGCPDVAMRYAFMDAAVDHGMGEGTYAELFTAAIESAAFFEKDIRRLIEIGLSKIPHDSRLAQSINLAVDSYDKGIDYRELRELLVEQSKDLGWFQAPANLGFVVLGLLYGDGDFKKSMIYSINCGDDTDCTGATVGALLGIINGTAGIPKDWSGHIGDEIRTIAVDGSQGLMLPKTCTELTDRVIGMMPSVMKANRVDLEYTSGESVISEDTEALFMSDRVAKELTNRSAYSYEIPDFIYASARVEFDREPTITPNGEIDVRLCLKRRFIDPRHMQFDITLPEGWTAAEWNRTLYMNHYWPIEEESWSVKIIAGEKVEPINRVLVQISTPARPTVGYIPIILIG